MSITCGIDLAEAHHDVAVLGNAGAVLGLRRVDTRVTASPSGWRCWPSTPRTPPGCRWRSRRTRTLAVVALQAAGLTVHAINPRAVARYRERPRPVREEIRPGDARCSLTCCAQTAISTAWAHPSRPRVTSFFHSRQA